MPITLAGAVSLFMSAFAKFAYARTLWITRRARRVGWTLAALGGLHVSCVVVGFFLVIDSQAPLSITVWTLPYLLSGLVATLLVYRHCNHSFPRQWCPLTFRHG